MDGGGTTASETVRYYYPDTGQIQGPGAIMRTVKGRIDIESAAEAGLVPKP